MLMCESDDNGKSFLLQNPSIECWEGRHPGYAALALIEMVVYMLLLPGFYVYLLLVYIPKSGLNNEKNLRTYGFLYERFLPDKHWWELLETMRKFVFAVIAKLGQNMATVDAAFIALVSVTFVMLCEVKMSPFKSALYDIVEEFTTLTEFSVLMLGIMALYRTNTDVGLEWIEVFAWFFLSISFCLVLLAASVDVRNGINLRWVRRLRTKGLLLSPAIFDLQVCKYLLPRFIDQATDAEIKAVRELEDVVAKAIDDGKVLHATDGDDRDEYTSIATLTPNVVDFMSNGGRLALRESKAAGQDAAEAFSGAVEKARTYSGATKEGLIKVPGSFLFNSSLLGTVCAFMDRKASPEDLAKFKTFLEAVQKYELLVRGDEQGWVQTVLEHMDLMGLRKHVQEKNRLLFNVVVPKKEVVKSYFKVSRDAHVLVGVQRCVRPAHTRSAVAVGAPWGPAHTRPAHKRSVTVWQ